MNNEAETFFVDLAEVCSETYAGHPDLPDHRADFPWLTGSLGDPFAPVWFVAENPSLTQVERVAVASPESQWSQSRGDHMLRDSLAKHGFKVGGALAEGGWHCYITDVLKSPVRVRDWQGTAKDLRDYVTRAWGPAMRYELEHGRPRLIVFLGRNAQKLLLAQQRAGLLPPLPECELIYHYSYVMMRPQGELGPGHPDRVAAWDAKIADIARRFPPQP